MKSLFTLSLILLQSMLWSQYFELKNPSPDLGRLRKVELATAQTLYIIAQDNKAQPGRGPYTLQKSTDNGATFSTVYETNTSIISSMDFVDALTGWILVRDGIADASEVLRTTNGGTTWSLQAGFPFEISDIAFYNMSSGLMSGLQDTQPVIYTTSDGGVTWTEDETFNGTFNERLIRVGFAQANQYYAASLTTFYLRTATAWLGTPLVTAYGEYLADAEWTERGCVIMTGNGRGFAKMSGINSNEFFNITIPSSSVSQIAINKQNALFMYAVGAADSLFVSTDMGGTWSYSGYYFGINDMSFNAFNGYLLLGRKIIKRTTDFGVNWSSLNGSYDIFSDVAFPNNEVGVVTGSGGTILTTTNSGETWRQSVFDCNHVFTEVSAPDRENIIVLNARHPGSLVKSIDGGNNWSTHPFPVNFTVSSVCFTSSTNGFAVGAAGKLYRTTNGGNSWSLIQTGTVNMLSSISFLDNSTGWIGTENGIMVTTDGGATWSSPSGSPHWFESVKPVSATLGYGTTIQGVLLKTTNGGVSWDSLLTRVNDIYASGSKLYVLQGDAVHYSNNHGSSFTNITPANVPKPMFAFAPIRKNLLSVVTQIGEIFNLYTSSANTLLLPEMTGASGSAVTVPVYIKIPEGRNFVSAEFTMRGYDTNMTFTGLETEGTIAGSAGWLTSVNAAENKIRFAASGTNLVDSSGVLVKLKFSISANAPEQIPLNFTYALVDNGFYETDTVNGYIRLLTPDYGDVDLNGFVQAYDGALVLQYTASLIGLNDQQKLNANVTTDNTISALDASVILRYITGIVTSLPYGGSGAAAGIANMSDIQAVPGQTVDIPLQLMNGNNIYSFEGNFTYNENLLEFTSLQWPAAVASFVKEVKNSNGRIYIAGAGVNKLDNLQGAQIALLRFRVKPGAAAALTEVTLEKLRLNENPVVINSASSVISITTGIENGSDTPTEYSLSQNYPNPFNPSTTISFALPQEGRAVLELYDIMGERIAILVDEYRQAGYHYYTLNTSEITGLTSGIYFYRLRSGAFTDTKKLILLK